MSRLIAATICAVTMVVGALASPAQAAVPSKKEWLADVHQAMVGSQRYVDSRVATGRTNLAINFDIDNTTLESHYDYGKAIPVVLRFASYARSQGVTMLFNTGRVHGDGRLKAAARLLREAGYHVHEICGRSSSSEGLAHSKQRCRQHFVDEGYRLMANVGNRSTDFTGGNYRRAFRLPSYHNQLA